MELVQRSGAGPSLAALLDPVQMIRNLLRHRDLVRQIAARDIAGRYRNSLLGMFWAVITPLVLLAIYTFVFSTVLKSKWGTSATETAGEFAITLFCGMLMFNVFAEVFTRAPTLVLSNPNLVKKVVFPLEVLVPAALLTALFNLVVGLGVWLIGWTVVMQAWPSASFVWLPLVLVPVCLTTVGLGWLLASLGVFLRDIGHVIGLVTQVLFFATPIFYRIDNVKPPFRQIIAMNPLTLAVEDARRVMMGSRYWDLLGESGGSTQPTWWWWLGSVAASAIVAWLGYAFFMKSKRAFADVI